MALRTRSVGGHDHLVEFYETEAFLVETVCDFLGLALGQASAVIVVATAAHRQAFETTLVAAGVAVDDAVGDGRYLAADAAGLLAGFLVDGVPDVTRFRATIEPLIDRASRDGREVRLYGEMVALLWDTGDVAAALALEDLWNDLARTRTFGLLCAYPMPAFDDEPARPEGLAPRRRDDSRHGGHGVHGRRS